MAGYLGTWEIQHDRLYLIEIKAGFDKENKTSLQDLFPGFSERVFAHWFTGELRIPDGEQLKYVHMGFGCEYERDIIINMKKGVVQNVCIQSNTAGDS